LALVVVAAGLLLLWRRRRRRARPASGAVGGPPAPVSQEEPTIVWAAVIRDALAARFGRSWRAKTTEEIVLDPQIADLLAADQLERLAALLRLADLAKFAGPSSVEPRADYRSDFEELVSLIAAPTAAGARSRINGK
jgi:hypothetical protein